VIGKETQTININVHVDGNLNFPDGLALASVTKTTFFLPVTFSILVFENDYVGDDPILKVRFDFGDDEHELDKRAVVHNHWIRQRLQGRS
jgi:hypothetical protein